MPFIFLFKQTTNYTDPEEILPILYELNEMAWTPMKPYKTNNHSNVQDESYKLTSAFIKLLDRCNYFKK